MPAEALPGIDISSSANNGWMIGFVIICFIAALALSIIAPFIRRY